MKLEIAREEIDINTSQNTILRIYEDVSSWPEWDKELDHVTLDGAFRKGTAGRLKPRGGPTFKFKLTEVDKSGFSDVSYLLGARLVFKHSVKEQGSGVVVCHEAYISGFLSPLFYLILKSQIASGLKKALQNLKLRAENYV